MCGEGLHKGWGNPLLGKKRVKAGRSAGPLATAQHEDQNRMQIGHL